MHIYIKSGNKIERKVYFSIQMEAFVRDYLQSVRDLCRGGEHHDCGGELHSQSGWFALPVVLTGRRGVLPSSESCLRNGCSFFKQSIGIFQERTTVLCASSIKLVRVAEMICRERILRMCAWTDLLPVSAAVSVSTPMPHSFGYMIPH